MRLAARDPWGRRTTDVLLSQLIALLANAHRDPKKHPLPFEPDFVLPSIPRRDPAAKPSPQTLEPQQSAAEAFNAALMAS